MCYTKDTIKHDKPILYEKGVNNDEQGFNRM